MSTVPPLQYSQGAVLAALYELHVGAYQGAELHVAFFDGREEMNGLYAFDVVFWGQDLDEAQLEASLLGTPVALAMLLPDGSARYVRGIVAALTLQGKHGDGRHTFRLRLVPRLWLLGKRVNSRIFQDLTVQQIVDVVLDEHGVTRDWSLLGKYPVRQYCVQYQESDLGFVTRPRRTVIMWRSRSMSFTRRARHSSRRRPLP